MHPDRGTYFITASFNPFGTGDITLDTSSATPSVPKRINYTTPFTPLFARDFMAIYTPFNPDPTKALMLYVQDPNTRNFNLLQYLPPDQPLYDDWVRARLVSGGLSVESSTVTGTNFTVSGVMNAVYLSTQPNFRTLSYQKLTSLGSREQDVVGNVRVSEGIIGLSGPFGDYEFNSIGNPYVSTGTNFLSVNYKSTGAAFDVPWGPVNPGSWLAIPQVLFDTNNGVAQGISLSQLNLLEEAEIRFQYPLTLGPQTMVILTCTITRATADPITYLETLVADVKQFVVTNPAGFAVTQTVQIDYRQSEVDFVNGEIVRVEMAVAQSLYTGTLPAPVNGGEYLIPNQAQDIFDFYLDSLTPVSNGYTFPAIVMGVSGVSAGQQMNITAVNHYEVVPNSNLSRNVKCKYNDYGCAQMLDLYQAILANPANQFNLVYPKNNWLNMLRSGEFDKLSTYDGALIHAGEKWNNFKDFIRTVYDTAKPYLRQAAGPVLGGMFAGAGLPEYSPLATAVGTYVGGQIFTRESEPHPETKQDTEEIKRRLHAPIEWIEISDAEIDECEAYGHLVTSEWKCQRCDAQLEYAPAAHFHTYESGICSCGLVQTIYAMNPEVTDKPGTKFNPEVAGAKLQHRYKIREPVKVDYAEKAKKYEEKAALKQGKIIPVEGRVDIEADPATRGSTDKLNGQKKNAMMTFTKWNQTPTVAFFPGVLGDGMTAGLFKVIVDTRGTKYSAVGKGFTYKDVTMSRQEGETITKTTYSIAINCPDNERMTRLTNLIYCMTAGGLPSGSTLTIATHAAVSGGSCELAAYAACLGWPGDFVYTGGVSKPAYHILAAQVRGVTELKAKYDVARANDKILVTILDSDNLEEFASHFGAMHSVLYPRNVMEHIPPAESTSIIAATNAGELVDAIRWFSSRTLRAEKQKTTMETKVRRKEEWAGDLPAISEFQSLYSVDPRYMAERGQTMSSIADLYEKLKQAQEGVRNEDGTYKILPNQTQASSLFIRIHNRYNNWAQMVDGLLKKPNKKTRVPNTKPNQAPKYATPREARVARKARTKVVTKPFTRESAPGVVDKKLVRYNLPTANDLEDEEYVEELFTEQ